MILNIHNKNWLGSAKTDQQRRATDQPGRATDQQGRATDQQGRVTDQQGRAARSVVKKTMI